MRDFRDAKAMAQSLRESLTAKAINISHSESLELVSKMLGVSDWNTLSALLQADQRTTRASVTALPARAAVYPAIPLRGLVPFPAATYPLFVGRKKTVHALNDAFARQREVVLAIQRDSAIDEPDLRISTKSASSPNCSNSSRSPTGHSRSWLKHTGAS